MTLGTFGDMARIFGLQQRNSILKQDIQKLNQEVATGQAADLAQHLGGSYAELSGIERDLRIREGFKTTIAEADQYLTLMQSRLGQISTMGTDFARSLIAGEASNSSVSSATLAEEGRQQFSTVVAILNSEAAGRNLFAGDTTDTDPLIDADSILAELETVVAGATTASDVEAALDVWFSSPAGFDTFAYTGSTQALSPFQLSETARIVVDVRADNQNIKDVMKGLAMAAMADAPGTSLSGLEKGSLFRGAGESLLTSEAGLVELQARLGLAQEQVSDWSVRNQAEKSSLDFAKGALLGVDPYEAATKLEATQFQLESLYAVTVRLSQLSLVNYLR